MCEGKVYESVWPLQRTCRRSYLLLLRPARLPAGYLQEGRWLWWWRIMQERVFAIRRISRVQRPKWPHVNSCKRAGPAATFAPRPASKWLSQQQPQANEQLHAPILNLHCSPRSPVLRLHAHWRSRDRISRFLKPHHVQSIPRFRRRSARKAGREHCAASEEEGRGAQHCARTTGLAVLEPRSHTRPTSPICAEIRPVFPNANEPTGRARKNSRCASTEAAGRLALAPEQHWCRLIWSRGHCRLAVLKR